MITVMDDYNNGHAQQERRVQANVTIKYYEREREDKWAFYSGPRYPRPVIDRRFDDLQIRAHAYVAPRANKVKGKGRRDRLNYRIIFFGAVLELWRAILPCGARLMDGESRERETSLFVQ